MVQLRRRLHLAVEALDRLGVAEELGVDDLQGHQAVHLPVPGLVDGPHAALAEQSQDLVARVVGQVGGDRGVGGKGLGGHRRDGTGRIQGVRGVTGLDTGLQLGQLSPTRRALLEVRPEGIALVARQPALREGGELPGVGVPGLGGAAHAGGLGADRKSELSGAG